MAVPICPVHQVPMKVGKGGGYFCARKNPDQSWCDQKAKAESAPAPASTFAPSPTPAAPGVSPKVLLAIASLEFAGRVYQGTGQADDALALANHCSQMPWEV